MSFQSKGIWMAKGSGHVTEGDAAFDNPSRIEGKRSHQWFVDPAEPELFSNKKQAVLSPNSKSASGSLSTSVAPWDNSSFQSAPNQFIDRLFGSETRPVNFTDRVISPVGTDISNARRKGIDDQFGEDVSAAGSLSISQTMEDPETCLTYNGIRKVKVNEVKECDSGGIHVFKGHDSHGENNSDLTSCQAYVRGNDTSFMLMGQPYDKVDDNVMIMGHNYSRDDAHVRSTGPTFGKGDDIAVSIDDTYNKDTSIISFSSFSDEHDIIPVDRSVVNYNISYNQSLQALETMDQKELEASNVNAAGTTTRLAKLKPESASKSKPELKSSKKEAPNSFPSNVRSLISTGMLDGVPVKYVSLSREELRGVIKGSGYLCGCQSCNYSKVLNAYEFERHAGCKTKHPNSHIYFENGKTIYQIVQELRSTPESMLFDTIQTVFGAPINQKSFRIWKESFQAATRELQRIYGKEELNL